MRLVTTDPDTAFLANAAGTGTAAATLGLLMILPFVPLIYPIFLAIGGFAMLASKAGLGSIHPMFQIIIMMAFCFGLWRAWRFTLAKLPIKVAAIGFSIWFAVNYGYWVHTSMHADLIWSAGAATIGAWVGKKLGTRFATSQHLRVLHKAE